VLGRARIDNAIPIAGESGQTGATGLTGQSVAAAVAPKPAIVQTTTSSAAASLGSAVPMGSAGRVSLPTAPVRDPSVIPHGPSIRRSGPGPARSGSNRCLHRG
jgi:hypothetical protein